MSVSASGSPGARSGDVISGTTSINPVVDIAMLAEFILIFPFTANRLYRKFNE